MSPMEKVLESRDVEGAERLIDLKIPHTACDSRDEETESQKGNPHKSQWIPLGARIILD